MSKVMVFGTFDRLHKGHLNFFQQAKKHGDKLIIVVARDENVKKIKGKLPKSNESKRLREARKAIERSSDRAILGQIKDPYQIIKKERPDVICLGYDQDSFDKDLKKLFPGIRIVRLKPYKVDIYKSSKINS